MKSVIIKIIFGNSARFIFLDEGPLNASNSHNALG